MHTSVQHRGPGAGANPYSGSASSTEGNKVPTRQHHMLLIRILLLTASFSLPLLHYSLLDCNTFNQDVS